MTEAERNETVGTPAVQAPPMEAIKASMRSTWMAGDFGVIARTVAADAESFIERLNLPAGARVLDVACGTGNTAIPLARQGCVVIGIDIAPNLLEQARERAAAEGLSIAFDEGDAEQLPYPDASFDAVVSMFGAMFAPRPERVAAEFARVLRPGGLLAMANWDPAGFSGQMFRLNARHAPPPPGLQPPVLWGDVTVVRERLNASFEDIATELIPILFDLPLPPRDVVTFFRTYFGPTQAAFQRLDESGQVAFATALEAFWSDANVSPNPDAHTSVPNSYLQVTATRR